MKIVIIILSFCFTITTFAQDYKFGKVSKEELKEKFNPMDSSANASYLFKDRFTDIQYNQNKGFEQVTEIHERIKIYNQEGFAYATKQILLYGNGGAKEDISRIKGFTYNLTDGKIVDSKLTNDGIFNSELNKYTNQVKFTMPNIKPGCVVEYKYTITSPFISNVHDFVFQHDIPVKKSETKFEAPEYFSFKLNTKGYLPLRPINSKKQDKIVFKNKIRSSNGYTSQTEYNTSEFDYTKHVAAYSLKNVPALKDEPFVNNIDNYRSTAKYELSYTKFPESSIEYYSTTWEDVVKKIFETPNFGTELDKSGYFEDEIDALISSVSDPFKRTSLIFEFVKSQVRWNGYYGYYTDEGVKKAFKERVGNVADINLMLTAMLRYAGLKANPVLVSTRQNGVPLFPTREGFNYVVSYVRLPEGTFLLDATSKYSTPNVLPFRALNWQGRVIAEHGGSELIDLYPNSISTENITILANLNADGSLKGQLRSVKNNHEALSFREHYNGINKDDFLEKLENKYNGIEVTDYEVKNSKNLAKPIVETYSFLKESQADIIGDKLYFSPLFYFKTSENPFKLEKREFPIDFGFPSKTIYTLNIKIPEGYQIESVPEPIAMRLPDNLGKFVYNISGNVATIQASISTEISQSVISSLYYDALKAYFNKFIEKEAEQIVLTKSINGN